MLFIQLAYVCKYKMFQYLYKCIFLNLQIPKYGEYSIKYLISMFKDKKFLLRYTDTTKLMICVDAVIGQMGIQVTAYVNIFWLSFTPFIKICP